MKYFRLWLKLARSYVSTNRTQFVFGFVISLLGVIFFPRLVPLLVQKPQRTIGMVGDYTVATLPLALQNEISYGLVRLDKNGVATSGAAVSWTATDSGKTFIFHLNPNLTWQDGQKLTSSQINYNLKGVDIEKLDQTTIKFSLKEPFSPLLTLLSQPLFKNGLVGLGQNKVLDIRFNGRFLSALHLENTLTHDAETIKFYTSEKNMVTALNLGAIREVTGLHDLTYISQTNLVKISQSIDSQSEVVLFFNTQKSPFDDKIFRQQLVYAMPDTFSNGETANSPLPKDSWAQTDTVKLYPHKEASVSAKSKITISTSRDLESVANQVAAAWKKANIDSNVEIAETLPINFDVYLTFITLPLDPDQYFLWHSTQSTNISGYKSFKVDKLLEEGRKEVDPKLRKEIYANFQRAITEDVPAAFLYYPKVYTVQR